MGAFSRHPSVPDQEEPITVYDGGKPVGNHDQCTPSPKTADRSMDLCLCFIIQG